MLTTSIIFLVLALIFGATGLVQFSTFKNGCQAIYQHYNLLNPGFVWFVAAGFVLILALVLLICTIRTKEKDRVGKKLPYYVSQLSTLALGVAALIYGIRKNNAADHINAAFSLKDADAFPKDGLIWIILGIAAITVALVLIVLYTLKSLSPAVATKIENSRVYGFFRGYNSEMKKIVWTSKKDVLRNTLLITITLVIVGLLVGLIDLGFTKLLLLIGG